MYKILAAAPLFDRELSEFYCQLGSVLSAKIMLSYNFAHKF